MTTQSVVVYTPIEHALYAGGLLFPLLAALVVGTAVFVTISVITSRWLNRSENLHHADRFIAGAALLSLVAAGFAFHSMAS